MKVSGASEFSDTPLRAESTHVLQETNLRQRVCLEHCRKIRTIPESVLMAYTQSRLAAHPSPFREGMSNNREWGVSGLGLRHFNSFLEKWFFILPICFPVASRELVSKHHGCQRMTLVIYTLVESNDASGFFFRRFEKEIICIKVIVSDASS